MINDKGSIHNFNLDGPNDLELGRTGRVVHGHKDDHPDAQEGLVQVLLRAARGTMFGNFKVS